MAARWEEGEPPHIDRARAPWKKLPGGHAMSISGLKTRRTRASWRWMPIRMDRYWPRHFMRERKKEIRRAVRRYRVALTFPRWR